MTGFRQLLTEIPGLAGSLMPSENGGNILAACQFRLFFGQLLHRVFIVIDQGHDLTAAMFFFTERLLTQAIFLEEDFTNFRQ